MGYDLTVTKGSVRLAEAQILIRDLLEFAAQMELEVIPVNWMVTGIVPDNNRLLREIFGEKVEEAQPLVSRSIFKTTAEDGKELLWRKIDREHVQGIVFCHHYGEWILTWNASRGGLLGCYHQLPERRFNWDESWFDSGLAVAAKHLLPSIDNIVGAKPVEIGGEISEGHISIHCPWRRSDAAAACDLAKLLARHSDNFQAQDGVGVWPDKDFTKWANLANKYAQALGACPTHPDATEELLSGDRSQEKSGDKD